MESARRSKVSVEKILEEIDFYNTDYSKYGNEIYEKISSRVAHWINFESDDFFSIRIHLLLDYIKQRQNIIWVDAGFSIPYLKTSQEFDSRTDIEAILVDKYQSAFDFYDIVNGISEYGKDRVDTLVKADFNERSCVDLVAKEVLRRQSNNHQEILVSAADVVEHLDDVSVFWELCREIQSRSGLTVRVYITLPVCDSIPSHKLAFSTERNALAFVESYLNVEESEILAPSDDHREDSLLKACVCAFGTLRQY